MAPQPLTRALVRSMSIDEYAKREAEVLRWLASGAVDGQPAPELVRADGHEFTLAEVAAMSVEEWEANEAAILAWTAERSARRRAELDNAPLGGGS